MNFIQFSEKAVRADVIENDITHFFSRYFAVGVAYLCYKLRATPNIVTFLFLAAGVSTSLVLYLGMPIVSYILWRLHIIIDMADGSLARATQKFSRSADGFDRSSHIIINTSIIFVSNQHVSNQLSVGLLTISFYLFYFFSRNYYSGKQSVRQFNLVEVLIKNAVGLEGYILTTILLMTFEATDLQGYVVLVYSCTFFIMYLLKLRGFINSQA